jgi:hypothetical protein
MFAFAAFDLCLASGAVSLLIRIEGRFHCQLLAIYSVRTDGKSKELSLKIQYREKECWKSRRRRESRLGLF